MRGTIFHGLAASGRHTAAVRPDVRHGGPNKFFGTLNSTGLCSLLGVAIELPEFPLSFSVAIRRMGSFVLVVLAHSMQSPFYGGRSRSAGL